MQALLSLPDHLVCYRGNNSPDRSVCRALSLCADRQRVVIELVALRLSPQLDSAILNSSTVTRLMFPRPLQRISGGSDQDFCPHLSIDLRRRQGKVPIRHVHMSLWGEVAVANTLLEVAGHDPPSLPPRDLGSFPHRLQKLSALLVSSAKRHIFVMEYHTLCLHSRVSPSHPLTPLHTHAAPPDQIPLISEHVHMAVFFIRALKTLCDRNKLSLSRFRIPAAIGRPVFGSPKQKSYRVWLNLIWNQSKVRSSLVSVPVII